MSVPRQHFHPLPGFHPLGVPAVELSEEDLRLLHALQIAPRVSWLDAAGILGSHPATLARRWERLRASGRAWITAHLAGDPSVMILAFADIECEPGLREQAQTALAAIPEVATIDVATGNPDLALTVLAPSLAECTERILPQIASAPGVLHVHSELCTRLHSGGHSWRLAALDREEVAAFTRLGMVEPHHGPVPEAALDLLPFLALNGRAGVSDMARALERSPATVHRQLAKILGSDLLTFRCEVAQGPAGYPVACRWLAKAPAGQHAQVAAALNGLRNVRLAASTTGRTNFIIMMWLRTVADVLTAELTLQERLPQIELVQSTVMLRSAKRVGFMLGLDGTATGQVVPGPGMPQEVPGAGPGIMDA
ncbi:Lrp/AsnC family transcriptional regulator [Arthrobacter woluwensis]|uniref:Lrp/AsnC family transcriptional regulator n=1 Tax=Arthrobacter woluwensis TaxID=156980 RepID=UPI001AAE80B2|nr:Lrp/AsnC family transcriptional regulator [Arthrobacter woluwensis]QTF73177.1 Lrp/AsnC family transcriptional regulator [Arthrobacter woluwensis]